MPTKQKCKPTSRNAGQDGSQDGHKSKGNERGNKNQRIANERRNKNQPSQGGCHSKGNEIINGKPGSQDRS
jgi:hypothetical protein